MTAAQRSASCPTDLHRFLGSTIRQVQALPLAHYEEPEADRGHLLAQVQTNLQVALDLLDLAGDHYQGVVEDATAHPASLAPGTLCSEVDRRMAGPEANDIANLTFVARLGLRGRLQTLETMHGDDPRWEVIAEAGSACREILKSLSAVEHSIADLEGIASDDTRYRTGLMTSLATRRTYAVFARDVVGDGPPTTETVVRRLRLTATAIAKLTGRDMYPDLRVADRIQFRSLQERILEWLRRALDDAAVLRAGLRLWQDVEAFAQLLRQVNHRAELRAHDSERLAVALARLEGSSGEVPSGVLADLAAVEGLDDTLDRWIAGGEAPALETLREKLSVLQAHLAQEKPTGAGVATVADPTLVDGDFL